MSQFASALCDPTHRSSPVHLLHNQIKNSLSYLQTQLLTYDQCPLWYYESKSALPLPEHCVTGLIFWCMVTSVIFFNWIVIKSITLLLWSVCFSVPVMWHSHTQTMISLQVQISETLAYCISINIHMEEAICPDYWAWTLHTGYSILGKYTPIHDIKHLYS